MPIQPVENRRLYRQIADQIAKLIDSGDYKPGSRLPPERDLAVQLGVSRPSVREALIALEVEGYVEVRVGSGVYVVEPPRRRSAPERSLDDETGPFELIFARRLVESECAALAAKSATAAQLDGIRAALEAMEASSRSGMTPIEPDRIFHLRIAEAGNNSAMSLMVDTLWVERAGPLFVRLEHHFNTPDLWRMAIEEHRAVVDAIAARDPAAARTAMRRHMDQAARRFGRNWQGKPSAG